MDRDGLPVRSPLVLEEMDEGDWPEWEPIVDWTPYVYQDPNVLVGKPVVRGTRLSVEFLLKLTASGMSEDRVIEEYPNLTREAFRAAHAFAAQAVRDRFPVVWPPRSS